MSKSYSNRALPSGTILREWRLEEVLGVGGFGIVYKGRGIYFDELVAIKEYFPGSISEREADDTVVPIDSEAEEVHALGLKKFVEEAKLLWNLSTPTRHPNIVNVRSLFEVHGTAYMVMDFEDGVSLSKMLKQGAKFNERSLLNIVKPIAEGLDRAHRVGVLHRDIKPPNILVNPDGRPVLIDFGSARFEAGDATSTKVTFHTPPYAALEQYVKTYDQGPWTDVYALGVVLYECVTGEKPPEVLERLHGGLGTPLADVHRPGYGRRFLAAIDAAMTIRPSDRPQSIPEWLAQFDGDEIVPSTKVEIDEDATRFVTYDKATEEIRPVAPPIDAVKASEAAKSVVPADPSEVEFKRAGVDTNAARKVAEIPPPPVVVPPVAALPVVPVPAPAPAAASEPVEKKAAIGAAKAPAATDKKSSRSLAMIGGAAVLLLAAAAGGWALLGPGGSRGDTASAVNLAADATPVVASAADPASEVEGLPLAEQALADAAREAGAPAAAVDGLVQASEQLSTLSSGLNPVAGDTAGQRAVPAAAAQMKALVLSANSAFAATIVRDAESKARGEAGLNSTLAELRTSAAAISAATDPAASLSASRQLLDQSRSFAAAAGTADAALLAKAAAAAKVAKAKLAEKARIPVAAVATVAAPVAEAAVSADEDGVSPAKLAQFNAIIDEGRGMAREVQRMARARGGAGEDRTKAEIRQANGKLAVGYDRYLAGLASGMRGVKSDKAADKMIVSAKQTCAYLKFLVNRSTQMM